jgi:hypothetical protein
MERRDDAVRVVELTRTVGLDMSASTVPGDGDPGDEVDVSVR